MGRSVIKLPDVMKKTCLSKAGIYSMIQKNVFPKPIKLGTRASGWIEDEVDAWIEDRIKERDN